MYIKRLPWGAAVFCWIKRNCDWRRERRHALCLGTQRRRTTLLYAADAEFFGVYARGTEPGRRHCKRFLRDAAAYCRWRDVPVPGGFTVEVVQEQESTLQICVADSDVLFDTERPPLTFAEYAALRDRTLRSARDFLALYRSPSRMRSGVCCRRAKRSMVRAAHSGGNVCAHEKRQCLLFRGNRCGGRK